LHLEGAGAAGDNLTVSRACIDDASVDLVHLDPPSNSQATTTHSDSKTWSRIADMILFYIPLAAPLPHQK